MGIILTELKPDGSKGEELHFPMIPEEITTKIDAVFQTYSILSLGTVKFPNGREPMEFEWEGIFPGKARKNAPYINEAVKGNDEWRNPRKIAVMLDNWCRKGTELELWIDKTPTNHNVYISSFLPKFRGGYGDCYYSIKFVRVRKLIIPISTTATEQEETPAVEEARPSPPPPKTHTVVSGDTLWGIAQKNYNNGSEYGKIYNANKDVIEAAAKKHGKNSSQNGHWIYPGTVLTIPS